jgi:hypothetical protein
MLSAPACLPGVFHTLPSHFLGSDDGGAAGQARVYRLHFFVAYQRSLVPDGACLLPDRLSYWNRNGQIYKAVTRSHPVGLDNPRGYFRTLVLT